MNYFLLLDIMRDFIDPLKPYWLELLILFGLLLFLMMLGVCETFRKAGKPSWGACIPFYNLYLLFDIVYKNGWRFLTLLIPVYNIFLLLILPFKLAKKFNHGPLFGFFLLIFPFGGYPVLGFDDSRYVDRVRRKNKVTKTSSKVVEEKIEKENSEKEEIISNYKKQKEEEISASLSLEKRRELAAKKRAMLAQEERKSLEIIKTDKNEFDHEKSKKIVAELEKVLEMMDESKGQAEAKNKIKNQEKPILNIEDPSFQLLKKNLENSIQSIREKGKEPLLNEEDTKILKESLGNSLPAMKDHLTSEIISKKKESEDTKNDKSRLLLDELESIHSILGDSTLQSESKQSTKERRASLEVPSSDPLSNELSFLDSILSPQK